ncbi:hypothetical protein HYDPIDRAFT_42526 [Hydnomerulius pinastri MD-312]|uniref:Uncharacterized protein n=1 Tax=Hydnomerulius pinastri MD-312 TaxID=994086 RepID=A0A0C9WBW1_9AGAM|nr:hypothetical protein HYDPIDRAFT_42526 [Hydnomerulius pinastri MD-312]
MVQTRSKKAAKYTYAERVLGAYSQAQKEHRKSSVHIATLRAHVRKTAESRKDKLGPQWANWVGKAVHKLEDQGILQPVEPSGHVSMTAEGKKALTNARRKVFGTTASHAPTPDEQEVLWRTVAEQFSPATHITGARRRQSVPSAPAGKKRRQSAHMRQAAEDDELEDEDDEAGPSASMRATPGAKRRRLTGVSASARLPAGTPQKSLSRMNKAELKAELRALQTKALASQTATPQATQQPPDPETQSLRKQLYNAQQEIATLRRQSVFGEPDEELTDLDDEEMVAGEVDATSSPSAVLATPTPTPLRPARPQMLGVTRTESGSLIPGVSGRPTPAPSEGEHAWDHGDANQDIGEGAGGDIDGDLGDIFMNDHADSSDTGGARQVVTPGLSPARRTHVQDLDELRGKVAILEESLTEKTAEIAMLKTELAHNDEALASLAEKETMIGDLQNVLTAKEEQIADLQSVISAKETTIAEKDAALAEHDATLSATRDELAQKGARISELESVLRDTIAAKDRTLEEMIISKDVTIAAKTESINQLQAALDGVEAEATELSVRVHTLEQAAQASEAELQLARQQGDAAQETAVQLQTNLENALDREARLQETAVQMDETLREMREDHIVMRERMTEMVQTTRGLHAELAERNDVILEKDAIIDEIHGRLGNVRAELVQTREAAEELATRHATAQTQAAENEANLRSSLEAAQAQKQVLTQSVISLQSQKTALEAQSEDFRGRVVVLARNLQTSRAEHSAAKATILGLLGTVDEVSSSRDEEVRASVATREALGIVEAEAGKLRDRAHDIEMEIQQCRGELAVKQVALVAEQTTASMLRSDLTVVHADLEAARSALETTKKQVVGVREDLKEAEDEAEALRTAKKADEGTIKELKGAYERLKKVQGEWMSELDGKIMSAQTTPVPVPRQRARQNAIPSTSAATA